MSKKKLPTPIREEEIKDLQAGDIVYLSGDVYTARDKAHQRIIEYESTDVETEIPIEKGAVLYHCGPLVRKSHEGGDYSCGSYHQLTSFQQRTLSLFIVES